MLLNLLFLFILDEWFEWPGHLRLIFDCELEWNFFTFDDIDAHKVIRNEHSHFWLLLTILCLIEGH